MNGTEIRILNIRLMNGGRPLKAFADIQIGDWIIRDFRVLKQNGGKAFISPPQVSWKDQNTGEIKFKGVLSMPSEEKRRIDTEILHAYQKEMEMINGSHR